MADNLTQQQRSWAMSRVKQKGTDLEKTMQFELHRLGCRFKQNAASLPGKPDLVFTKSKVAIFIDGDFWHGYRLPSWEHNLSEFWRQKISRNRQRDRRNFRKLRSMGWRVIRIWQHQIKADVGMCTTRVTTAISQAAEPLAAPTSKEKD